MGDIKAFAENAPSGKRTVFNETTQSDDITTNLNNSYTRGWEVIGDNAPSIQDINAVGYTQGYLISYLYQQGVPAWSSEQGYIKYNMVNFEGKIYSCKIGDDTNRCYNKNPKTELSYWKEIGIKTLKSESNIGSSFLVKFSSKINNPTSGVINSNSFELIRTKSDNGFSQVDNYKFYSPKKGVYFFRASLTFEVNVYEFSNSKIERFITDNNSNNSKIIILKNGVSVIETKFSFLFSRYTSINYPVSVSGLVELDERDFVSFAFTISGVTISDMISITEGSFIGYKI